LIVGKSSYDERWAMLLVLPVMAVLAIVAIYPIVHSFYTSLYDIVLTRPHRTPFVGLANYITVFDDARFWVAVRRTTVYTIVSVVGTAGLALVFALLLNEAFPGRRFLSIILLIPWATPSIVNGLMWKWIYDPNFGSLNGLLDRLGLIDRYQLWLADPDKTLLLVAQAAIWKQMPLAAILLLVTMKAIPDDLYRAAKVDGATVLQRFLHVTIPGLRPGFMLVFVYETMISIRHFDLFAIMTQGGPGDATFTVSWMIYTETFNSLRFGTGSAIAFILSMATFALSYALIRLLGKDR
jgi:multiple sugar transport system permease protein